VQQAVAVYSSDELDIEDGGVDENNVHLKGRLEEGKKQLDAAREALRYLCEPVPQPREVELRGWLTSLGSAWGTTPAPLPRNCWTASQFSPISWLCGVRRDQSQPRPVSGLHPAVLWRLSG